MDSDPLASFELWLMEAQRMELATLKPDELIVWRESFASATARAQEHQARLAPMRSKRSNDRRYGVAIEDSKGLGLTFWIKRSGKGEIFLFYPRDPASDPHSSYHLDGTYHFKSHGTKLDRMVFQPLGPTFRGTEHLGTFAGHGAGPRISEPGAFDDLIIAPPGVLTAKTGRVVVDLVEPGCPVALRHREPLFVVEERVYKDAVPWIVVAIARSS